LKYLKYKTNLLNLSDIFKNLFPAQEPARGETKSFELSRSDEYLSYYKRWLLSEDKTKDIAAFRKAYESVLSGNSIHDIIELPTQSVFIFNNENNYVESLHLHFLIDWFREELMKSGYRSYFSDLRITMFEEGISRKISRHYLKVSFDPAIEDYPSNSLFGNIYLEVVDENNHIVKMRIICNYLQQRKRNKEKSIHELVEFLLCK
jgi:hypothetical protein